MSIKKMIRKLENAVNHPNTSPCQRQQAAYWLQKFEDRFFQTRKVKLLQCLMILVIGTAVAAAAWLVF